MTTRVDTVEKVDTMDILVNTMVDTVDTADMVYATSVSLLSGCHASSPAVAADDRRRRVIRGYRRALSRLPEVSSEKYRLSTSGGRRNSSVVPPTFTRETRRRPRDNLGVVRRSAACGASKFDMQSPGHLVVDTQLCAGAACLGSEPV